MTCIYPHCDRQATCLGYCAGHWPYFLAAPDPARMGADHG